MTQTATPKTYGPRQAKDVAQDAEMVRFWALDLEQAIAAGDLARVTAITAAMTAALARVTKTTERAAR